MTHRLIAFWLWWGRRSALVYGVFATVVAWLASGLVWVFGRERRHVALTNLRLCFPALPESERRQMARRNMYLYVRTFLDRAWVWQQPQEVLKQRIGLEGIEHLKQAQSQGPVILLAPHFLGLDAGWTRLCMEIDMVTMYSNQKNPVLNQLIRKGREHMGHPVLLSRQEGVRGIVKALKAGRPLYYLPDMDFGEKDAVFVPFFGQQAATVTAVARLARLVGAQVLFCPTWMQGDRYCTHIMPALEAFPGDMDDTAATALINQHIERLIQHHIPEYLWLHKRFKTQAPGLPKIY